MRVFRPIVSINSLLMVDIDLQSPQRGTVGTQFIGNDCFGLNLLPPKQLLEQAQSSSSISS